MAENRILTTDLRSSNPDALIELFELELSQEATIYFHAGVDEDYTNIEFDGNTYIALPVSMTGLEVSSEGSSARPVVQIANVTNVFKSALNDESFKFGDLIGTRLTKRRTLAKYLTGGTEEDNPFEFPVSAYIIDRVSGETSLSVEFELASPFDVEGVKIPARNVIGKYCSWMYQGSELKGRGGCFWPIDSKIQIGDQEYNAYFDEDDRPLVPISAETSFSTWSAGSYGFNALVEHDNKYWISKATVNDAEPGTLDMWQEVLLYSTPSGIDTPEYTWDASQSYSAGDYIEHISLIEGHSIKTVWKCTIDNNAPSIEPSTASPYWIKADQCSKKLSGCKSRFQYTLNQNSSSVPSIRKNTRMNLPFGAFPGSVKFK